MTTELFDGFDKTVCDALQESAVSEGADYYALTTGFCDKVCVYEELFISQYLFVDE
jgi:hypothetical protein